MSQQTDNSPGALAPSLRAKLEQFADGLTPDEQAEMRAMQGEPEDVTGMLSPSLEDKARRAVEELTPEEEAELYRLLAAAGAGASDGADASVEGYSNPLYDDGWGNKARPGGVEAQGGGGRLNPVPRLISKASEDYNRYRDFARLVADLPSLVNLPYV